MQTSGYPCPCCGSARLADEVDRYETRDHIVTLKVRWGVRHFGPWRR